MIRKHAELCAILREKKLNQCDLANALNISQGAISRLLKGERKLHIQTALNLSTFLKIPLKELLTICGYNTKFARFE